jgi:hypothetical protein
VVGDSFKARSLAQAFAEGGILRQTHNGVYQCL